MVPKSAWSSNLFWRNVLYFLDRNKKMFSARVMQEYTSRDDDTTMGIYNRVEHPLAESTPFQSGEPST